MKPTRSWIVIADGAQARILENHGPGKGLVPLPAGVMQKTSRPSRDIDTDRPGRGYNPMGQHHTMDSPSDSHREEKRRFADLLANHKIGRASGRERVGPYVEILVGTGSLKKNTIRK